MFCGPQNVQSRLVKTHPNCLEAVTKRGKLRPRFGARYVAEIGHIRSTGRHVAAVELDGYWARKSRMFNFHIHVLSLSLVAYTTGCVSSPINKVDSSGKPVETITLSGARNLGDSQVRVTDSDEIDDILKLIRKIRGVKFVRVNFDIEEIKVVTIRIEQKDGPTELTMVSKMMAVPGDDMGLFYDSQEDAQSELWNLILKHLEQNDAQ